MFVDNDNFLTLGNRTDSQWYEVLQQHQITVDGGSEFLGVSVDNFNLDKVSWYNIWWGWTNGRPILLKYDNALEMDLTKIYSDQLSIENLNPQQDNKLVVVSKIP